MLGCFILIRGTTFTLEINKNLRNFTQQKEAIWEYNMKYFKDIGKESGIKGTWDIDIEREFIGSSTWIIANEFLDPPPEEFIHIIVQQSITTGELFTYKTRNSRFQFDPRNSSYYICGPRRLCQDGLILAYQDDNTKINKINFCENFKSTSANYLQKADTNFLKDSIRKRRSILLSCQQ
ncbi:hypothetical protein GLOIN_2v1848690 [Rhizophagus clarus]|uniref:Uncharacterized protein n=1 Tax=Rhizophagus clarus TaxID=94130 RepID=A0A8H3M1V0_9GLOM|nr:hypothetical protein GLOIN_2v1848690 [Rhizophagus clarus]